MRKALDASERRNAIERAADLLAKHAAHKAFVASYARMNPATKLQFNSFYFGAPHFVARVVVFGPWLYIHAPNIQLSRAVTQITREERHEKHLGNLHARMLLTTDNSLSNVREIIHAFKRGAKRLEGVPEVTAVRPPKT